MREPFTELDEATVSDEEPGSEKSQVIVVAATVVAALTLGVAGFYLAGGPDAGSLAFAQAFNGVLFAVIGGLLFDRTQIQAARGHKFRETHDLLTGLYNRSYMFEYVPRLLAAHDRDDSRGIGLALFRLTDMHQINRDYGHEVGDALLMKVADAVRAEIRTSDIAVRSAGEEFTIFVSVDAVEKAQAIAERIAGRIRNSRFAPLPPDDIGVSVGFAYHTQNTGLDEFLAQVDQQVTRDAA